MDGGAETVSLTSPDPEDYTQLNDNSGWLFLGGLPSSLATEDVSLLFPGEPRPLSAFACFHALSVNRRYINIR